MAKKTISIIALSLVISLLVISLFSAQNYNNDSQINLNNHQNYHSSNSTNSNNNQDRYRNDQYSMNNYYNNYNNQDYGHIGMHYIYIGPLKYYTTSDTYSQQLNYQDYYTTSSNCEGNQDDYCMTYQHSGYSCQYNCEYNSNNYQYTNYYQNDYNSNIGCYPNHGIMICQ